MPQHDTMERVDSRISTELAVCRTCGEEWKRTVTFIGGQRVESIGGQCPRCVEGETEAEEERLRRERAERIELLLDQVGVNVRLHGRCTLEEGPEIRVQFDTSDSGPVPLEAAQSFLTECLEAGRWDPVRGLMISGSDTGAGKSHLAAAITRGVLLDPHIDPREVVFDHAGRLITEIQDTYGTGQTSRLLGRRERAALWVLDDLGAEKASEDAQRIIYGLLHAREAHPTVITSNYLPDELAGAWRNQDGWARISSRLGQFRVVKVRGRDRRFEA